MLFMVSGWALGYIYEGVYTRNIRTRGERGKRDEEKQKRGRERERERNSSERSEFGVG